MSIINTQATADARKVTVRCTMAKENFWLL